LQLLDSEPELVFDRLKAILSKALRVPTSLLRSWASIAHLVCLT
jgi:hypothetical protein